LTKVLRKKEEGALMRMEGKNQGRGSNLFKAKNGRGEKGGLKTNARGGLKQGKGKLTYPREKVRPVLKSQNHVPFERRRRKKEERSDYNESVVGRIWKGEPLTTIPRRPYQFIQQRQFRLKGGGGGA